MGSLRHSKRIRSASTKQRASACWPSAKVRISCETKLARARERPWCSALRRVSLPRQVEGLQI